MKNPNSLKSKKSCAHQAWRILEEQVPLPAVDSGRRGLLNGDLLVEGIEVALMEWGLASRGGQSHPPNLNERVLLKVRTFLLKAVVVVVELKMKSK